MSAIPSGSELTAPRPRAAHLGPERRRPLILDVAMALFVERGYKGTSMDAIAQAAGVTKPVIYDCFASKADLFGALLDREEQRMFERFGEALMSGSQPGDVQSTLASGFTSMLKAVVAAPQPYRVVLLGGGEAAAALSARVTRGRERHVEAVATLAKAWLEGRVPDERVEGLAQFIAQTLISVGEAGTRMILAEPERWSPEELGGMLAGLATGGYGAAMR
jgi:AcrR family transcriptional regulator